MKCLLLLLVTTAYGVTDDLKGVVTVITGSTRGLGESMVMELAKRGGTVVINGRNMMKGKAVEEKCTEAGGTCLFVPGDVSKLEDVANLFAETKKAFGAIDCVVANAGVFGEGMYDNDEGLKDAVALTVNVNILGTTYTVSHGLRALREKPGGSLILISSVGGSFTNGAFNMFPKAVTTHVYAASKSYIDGLGRGLTVEHPDVRTYVISPAVYGTDMPGDMAPAFAQMLHSVLPGVVGDPADIAACVASIIDNTSAWPPGSNIAAEGQFTYDAALRYEAAYDPKYYGTANFPIALNKLMLPTGLPSGVTQAVIDQMNKDGFEKSASAKEDAQYPTTEKEEL